MKFVLLGLSLILLSLSGCGTSSAALDSTSSKEAALQAKPVTIVPVLKTRFEKSVQATGSLEPRDNARIRALVGGPLDQVHVDIGDRVDEGKVLFRVRQIEAELTLRSAEAGLQTAQAALNDLLAWQRTEEMEVFRAELGRAQAEYERLARDAERAETVFQRGAISESQLQAARTSAKSAEAAVNVARERLAVAESGPTVEQIEVARSRIIEAEAVVERARQTLVDTSVRAPFPGVVTGRSLKAGDYVNRGEEVVTLSGLSFLEAEARVPERFSLEIVPGIPVRVQVDSLGIEREGEVIAVNQAIDPGTRTFLVKVGVQNQDLTLKAGVFSVCTFELPPVEDGLGIPSAAVQTVEGRTFVWVEKEGTAHRVNVDLGERMDGYVQVVKGLDGSERVLVEGIGALVEGDEIVEKSVTDPVEKPAREPE
jgi:multidrug efflux pump subunit AcrA (membrane-fusion protein)